MKELSLEQMEEVNGKGCGEDIIWSAWAGGVLYGGVGGVFGGAAAALYSPNCLNLQ